METADRQTSGRSAVWPKAIGAVLAALGALATWSGVGLLRSGATAAVGPLVIGLALLGVAAVLLVLVPRALATASREELLRIAHPDRPWAWREDWAAGRISGSGRTGAFGLLAFALVWNAFTWPVAWLFLTRKAGEEHVWIVLIFPAAGLLLFGLAAYGILQMRRHGRSFFVLETNPGVVGRTLQGRVETTLPSAPPDGVEVRLRCERRRTTRSGKNSTTHVTTLWQDHVTVEPADLAPGPAGLRIPVVFAIPPDVPPYRDADPHDAIRWRLEVSAAVPGIDYSDSFDVPVFQTGAPPLDEREREELRARRRERARAWVPAAPLFRSGRTSRGGTVLSFTPRTGFASGVGAVAATAAAWAGTWWLHANGVAVAPWIVGVIAVLFTLGTAVALFHRSSVTVEGSEVTLRHRILGIGTTRRLRAEEVRDVRAEVVGEGGAQSWEVVVKVADGGSYSAAAHFATQRDADWTAEQIRALMPGTTTR